MEVAVCRRSDCRCLGRRGVCYDHDVNGLFVRRAEEKSAREEKNKREKKVPQTLNRKEFFFFFLNEISSVRPSRMRWQCVIEWTNSNPKLLGNSPVSLGLSGGRGTKDNFLGRDMERSSSSSAPWWCPCGPTGCAPQLDDDAGGVVCTNCGTLQAPDEQIFDSSLDGNGSRPEGIPTGFCFDHRLGRIVSVARTGAGVSLNPRGAGSSRYTIRGLTEIKSLARGAEQALSMPGTADHVLQLFQEARERLRDLWSATASGLDSSRTTAVAETNLPPGAKLGFHGPRARLALGACFALVAREHRIPLLLDEVAAYVGCPGEAHSLLKWVERIRLAVGMGAISKQHARQFLHRSIDEALTALRRCPRHASGRGGGGGLKFSRESLTQEAERVMGLAEAWSIGDGRGCIPLAVAVVVLAVECLTCSKRPLGLLERIAVALQCSEGLARTRLKQLSMAVFEAGGKLPWIKDLWNSSSKDSLATTSASAQTVRESRKRLRSEGESTASSRAGSSTADTENYPSDGEESVVQAASTVISKDAIGDGNVPKRRRTGKSSGLAAETDYRLVSVSTLFYRRLHEVVEALSVIQASKGSPL
ncbi:hypothetical protein DFJ73DRAFT_319641 [Zopfochytrium polystomum]|nr:hypothetical protein DFJ73DRAFT_319641 [Zopfochytrium polystomum]